VSGMCFWVAFGYVVVGTGGRECGASLPRVRGTCRYRRRLQRQDARFWRQDASRERSV
jgi:hypothetical protein